MTIGKRASFICVFFFNLVACSQSSSTVDEKDDIIAKRTGISNLYKFEKFVLNVEQGKVDEIRIVNYTHEGDPIFQTLEHSGKEIRHILDNRRDEFAGDNKGVQSDSCKRIVKEVREVDIRYRLIDCMNEDGRNGYDLLDVPLK
ncbi:MULTISPECIES: DUF4362 domain-containing protein [Bacillus]|uniref:DUF4362 domain-containing protein n=1 Tax=Bacillus TaxID=1386 RepID=UPI001C63A6E1|nr:MULTISPECIES: DUF4362 domain-containing protein [Bacillus]QWU47673.1 DUF4362 domain-containing protein [Bacillus sp. NP247]UYX51870.1 DUF4362 domain-containing protein [Bacillus thuringiensis]